MNLNYYGEELKKEEQRILDELIARMDEILDKLDQRMQQYVREAKDASISVNPDQYLSLIIANKGMKDSEENRKKFLNARDELYHTRLLLEVSDSHGTSLDEIKIGLHHCQDGEDIFVTDWKMPVCRHYILNNSSTEYHGIVKDKKGMEYHTDFKLLVKDKVELRFTRVVKAMNLYPGKFDEKTLKAIKGKDFFRDEFLDEMIHRFNLDDFDPDGAAKIISDEFLQELLERRSTPEFKNIVFSIQKKQGEIIQAPYDANMIVQGCAGSGKSMIMLHRLPIILYDNPASLVRSSLHVISPSPMYIQMAENMRHQLEISDINMGTIEQYYDVCINRYPGHKAGDYGKINYRARITQELEQYVYSEQCIGDIHRFYDLFCKYDGVSLEKAYAILGIKPSLTKETSIFAQKINSQVLEVSKVLNANNTIVVDYFKGLRDVIDAFNALCTGLKHRKDEVNRAFRKEISSEEESIKIVTKEMEKLDSEQNAVAIKNRQNTIDAANKRIAELKELMTTLDTDEHFEILIGISKKIEDILSPFDALQRDFEKNTVQDIYDAIARIGRLIGAYHTYAWEISRVDDKYSLYVAPISRRMNELGTMVEKLQDIKGNYLEFDYYSKIRVLRNRLSEISTNAIRNAYLMVLEKLGITPNDKGNVSTLKCSPYLYLQVLYQYYGTPSSGRDTLLSIDEAQGIAPEEIRLLNNVNGGRVVFNLFGDERQHIEGTKGIDRWSDLSEVLEYKQYDMQENYRNASQITEFCNRKFGMDMRAINTPGKGVHELKSEEEFRSEMVTQLMDTQRAGLAAILVSTDIEAKYLLGEFAEYAEKFHDMTGEDFGLHRTRWNIMTIADAKGLEFSSVIAISGRMTENEKYIAYTRALDELFVYESVIDVTEYEKKARKESGKSGESQTAEADKTTSKESGVSKVNERAPKHVKTGNEKTHIESDVRDFFVAKGLEVVDMRDEGGRLWVVGDKTEIRDIVNEAIAKFEISGKYAASKDIKNKAGWCTKTDK